MTSISKNVYINKFDDIVSKYNKLVWRSFCDWKKQKTLCCGSMLLVKGKVIVGAFYEKELQKRNQKGFRMEKVIKRKDDKLYVKCKGYNSSFKS